MKNDRNLTIHSITATLFGVIFELDPVYADKIAFFGRELGLVCLMLGTVSFFAIFSKRIALKRWMYYLHSGVLLGLTSLGFVRQLQGESNVMWIFTLELFVFIILSIRRGDVFE
ncbi:hypothetical protein [Enterococcus pallens]|uniref:Uncharacterized protein n=1 Tax=Enterococcus pallens ATCC BAA-351 TaxID=1158607 RepID=R2RTN3_9ENTE|nr:hypothetical protein [Enterococcus pallens]EOH86685.1 hypothetical protein UAU_05130 [Enterococcus pallens ATCC BAA-351]EOU18481.1 hypothetical protein I588_03475 [Enterococcus pallens ATCC BAA-351]